MFRKKIIIILISITQINAFEFKESSPESLFPARQAANSSSLPTGSSNPADLPHISGSFIHMSLANPYSINGLYAHKCALVKKLPSSALLCSFFYFGIKEYNETSFETAYAYSFKGFTAGTIVHFYRQEYAIEQKRSHEYFATCGISARYSVFPWLILSGLYDNALALLNRSQETLCGTVSTGISIKPMKGVAFNWNINKDSFGYYNTYSCSLNILPFFSIKAGYINENNSYTTACSLIIKKLYITYGFRYHPYLGVTHSFGTTYTFKPLQLTTLNYYPVKRAYTKKRLDIQTCTKEQLLDVPGISEELCERITTYKKIIGPISIKALKQISPGKKEARVLLDHTYGFVDYPAAKRPKTTLQKKHYIFSKLLQAGATPTTAFDLVVLIQKKKKQQIKKYIYSSNGFTQTTKERLYRTCLKLF